MGLCCKNNIVGKKFLQTKNNKKGGNNNYAEHNFITTCFYQVYCVFISLFLRGC